jgi:TonB family protein
VLAFLPGSNPPRRYDWSAAAIATLATAAVFTVSTGSMTSAAVSRYYGAGVSSARYLLPPIPHQSQRGTREGLQWVEAVDPTRFPSFMARTPSLRGVGSRVRPARAGQGVPLPVSPTAVDIPDFTTSQRVYVESELDRPVVRDPLSAAPEYPIELEKARVEGFVAVEFVVDSTGHADSTSLRIVSVSHMAFADAVRNALPQMLFSPAELEGRHVPQRVMQVFKFVLPQTATNAPTHDASLKSSGSR